MRHQRFTILAALILIAAAGVVAEPAVNGTLRHELGATLSDGLLVRNAVISDVTLSYRGSAVDVLVNPYFEVRPTIPADPDATVGLREAYIDYFTKWMDFRIGKQVIIWGRSDGLAVTDIVSPKDLTHFLIPEFRTLRLGVVSAQANAYLGPAALQVIYVPQFSPSILPAPGSIWFVPLDAPVTPTLAPAVGGGFELTDGEVYLRLRMQTTPLDFDLVHGHYWTNEPSPTIERSFSAPGVLSAITVTPEYYRQVLFGGAVSSTVGPFIFRGESGYFNPKRLLTTDMTDSDGYVEKGYVQSLLGADSVVAGIDVSAQVLHHYVVGWESALQQDEHSWTATARARRSFFRDTLVVDALGYVGFAAPDALLKVGVTLAPADALAIRVEGNIFFGDQGQFGSYDDNDLVLVSTTYSF